MKVYWNSIKKITENCVDDCNLDFEYLTKAMNYGSLDCFMNGDDEMNNFGGGGDDGEWIATEAVMDSGSADCVARSEMFPQVEMEESPGSKAGQCWTTATKEEVPNEGQKTVPVVTEEGRNKKICWQIAPVHKPLMAVGKNCDQENICVFGKRGGFIRANDTGELTKFWRKMGSMLCGCG